MNKLYTENGFLSTEGDRVFKEILDGKISILLNQAENENELRLVASLIHKRISDMVSDVAQEKRKLNNSTDLDLKEELDKWAEAAKKLPRKENNGLRLAPRGPRHR